MYPMIPIRNPFVGIVFFRQIFTIDECDRILASLDEKAWEEAEVGGHAGAGQFSVVSEVRSNRQQHLPVDPEDNFPVSKITQHVAMANSEGWRFEISGIYADDYPWVMRYDEGGRGHNDWHIDIGQGANASRKLAFSIQLTDGDEYEGGDLEFHNTNLDKNELRKKGVLAIFPAYWLHRVAPVTKGTRYATVGWIHGPSFR